MKRKTKATTHYEKGMARKTAVRKLRKEHKAAEKEAPISALLKAKYVYAARGD
jgi:hypothetical protein